MLEGVPAGVEVTTADVERGLARRRLGYGRGARMSFERDEVAFLDAFASAMPDNAVVVADMCIPGYWLAGLGRVPAPRRLQYPMGWGTLGYAFPAALGAACAGDGPVVSVSGDGGFLFACGELATAYHVNVPLDGLPRGVGGVCGSTSE